jgi:hypothetical protein
MLLLLLLLKVVACSSCPLCPSHLHATALLLLLTSCTACSLPLLLLPRCRRLCIASYLWMRRTKRHAASQQQRGMP